MLGAMSPHDDDSGTGSGEPTTYTLDSGVATITLNLPERKNALSDVLVDNLSLNIDRALADDAVRVIVLTNTGNTFCAGADLKAPTPGVAPVTPRRTFLDVLNQILDSPKPVIGRIDGHAMAGGVGLVAACDLSVMRDDARLGFTEVRIGVAPAVISVVCLPKLNRADASELFLCGDRIAPARAAEVGLINRAVPPEQLDAAVDDYVSMVIRGGPIALAATKDLIRRVPNLSRADGFAWTSLRSRELFQSEEATEGIASFRERRDPNWVPGA